MEIYQCSVHGKCVIPNAPKSDGIKCCRFCSERAVAPPPFTGIRHLVYHLLPVAGRWRDAAAPLLSHWSVFTGRKVVAISTGGSFARGRGQEEESGRFQLDPPDDVRSHLPPDCEVLEIPNDPELREVATWAPLWESLLPSTAPGDRVLYAHAKGVTRRPTPQISRWVDILHEACLSPRGLAVSDGVLDKQPIAGPFRKRGRAFAGSESQWHYSGAFFWVNAEDFARRPWREVDRRWWGVEAWPGRAYRPDEAGVVFGDGAVADMDLFHPPAWGRLEVEYEKWKGAAT